MSWRPVYPGELPSHTAPEDDLHTAVLQRAESLAALQREAKAAMRREICADLGSHFSSYDIEMSSSTDPEHTTACLKFEGTTLTIQYGSVVGEQHYWSVYAVSPEKRTNSRYAGKNNLRECLVDILAQFRLHQSHR